MEKVRSGRPAREAGRLGIVMWIRLLTPGIRVKRWLLVVFIGMLFFGIGFSLLANPANAHSALWKLWVAVNDAEMPRLVAALVSAGGMLAGVALVGYGMRRLIRAFTMVANPHATGRQLVEALLDKHNNAPRLRIVGLGGGTGLSTLLRGLKNYSVDLTAIVTVSDDGGSSGRLRMDLDMPPPGDIRSCLVALAEAEPLMEQLFQYRFPGRAGELDGHSLGNLIIAGLREMTGDFQAAIREVSRVLAVRGRVLPSAHRALVLKATMADGRVVEGETAIVANKGTIVSITIDPPDVAPLPEAIQAIREADVIIVGPGSVYSSLLPNLIIPGMAEELARAQALKFFICNVMTQPGESDNFSASRHLQVMLEHLPCGGNPFDFAMVNLQRPPKDVMALYGEKGQQFVEPDLANIRAIGTTPVTGALLADTHLARHDPDKLAYGILETVAKEINWPNVLKRKTPKE